MRLPSRRRGYLRFPAILQASLRRRRGYLRFPAILGLTALSAAGVAAQVAQKGSAPALEIEVAQIGRTGPLCMRHEGAALAAGTRIWLVQPDSPQSVATAVPGSGHCGAWPDRSETGLVPLRVVGGALDSTRLSVAIVGARTAPAVRDGVAGADLDGDGVVERFRACTSSEGVHLTIWSGRPPAGRLRWHRYFYLGYDVDPSCTPADSREPAPGAGLGRHASPTGA